jgi:ribosomal protein L16/L10AE
MALGLVLTTAQEVIIKVLKSAKVYSRVFPDIPGLHKGEPFHSHLMLICGNIFLQGNETRMGKGKEAFGY